MQKAPLRRGLLRFRSGRESAEGGGIPAAPGAAARDDRAMTLTDAPSLAATHFAAKLAFET
ncbi:MAG TPA: hypothetical protein VIL55_11520, partial [Naasia sp.]